MHICKPENLLTYDPSDYPTCAEGNRHMFTVLMSTILLDSIYKNNSDRICKTFDG